MNRPQNLTIQGVVVAALGFAAFSVEPARADSWCFRQGDTMEAICAFNSLERCVDAAKIMGGKCETEASVLRLKQCDAERKKTIASGKPPRACG